MVCPQSKRLLSNVESLLTKQLSEAVFCVNSFLLLLELYSYPNYICFMIHGFNRPMV